jgi:type IV pilus assembly protein PilW
MTPGAPRFSPATTTGFSLVEVLVGMAIALIGIVIMFQVMENAESRKRTTAAGGDAQISGSIAMYNLERDIRLAGYGFGSSASLGCTVNAYDTARGSAAAGKFTFLLLPLQIVDGAGGASDQIISFYGNSPSAPVNQSFDCSTSSTKRVASTSSRGGIERSDLLLVTNGATCAMVEVTQNTQPSPAGLCNTTGTSADDQRSLWHAIGAYTNPQNDSITARYNDPDGFTTASGQLHNLGNLAVPRRNIWQITNGRILTVTDDLHFVDALDQTVNPAVVGTDGQNDQAEISEGIVNLQAQYGLDTTLPRDYVVDTWQSTAPADWTQLVAVRVALLARSQQYEKTNVTAVAPTWLGGGFTMTNLDGTSGAAAPANPVDDWRRYRYRVYQATIPLRNMIWGTAP